MLLEGLYIPLTTPFHSDGRLHPHKLAANIARYSKTPAAGLIVLSPSSEPTLLSDDETREVLRTAANAAAPEKVLVAGISRDSVLATLALATFAVEQNYDAVLIGLPSILTHETPASSSELLTYFRTLADRSPLPLILLSTPTRPILLDAIAELAAHPNIIALLDTYPSQPEQITHLLQHTVAIRREVTVTPTFTAVTARMRAAAEAEAATRTAATFISADTLAETYSGMLATIDAGLTSTLIREPDPAPAVPAPTPLRIRTKTIGFQVLAASTPSLTAALNAGASAIAPAFAAAAPQACYEVFAAWKDSDQPLAEEKQSRLVAPARLAESLGPAGLKFACDLNGYFGGLPRLPHLPPTGDQRTALEQLLEGIRN